MKKIIILGVGEGPLPTDILTKLVKGFENVGENVQIVNHEDFLNAIDAEKAMELRKCSAPCDPECPGCVNKNMDEEIENVLASMGFIPKVTQPYDGYGFKAFEELYGISLHPSAIELVKILTDIKTHCGMPNVALISDHLPHLMTCIMSNDESKKIMPKLERLFNLSIDFSCSQSLAKDISILHEAFSFKRRMAGYIQS